MTFAAFFRQLHRASSPLTTFAQMLQTPLTRDNRAVEDALAAIIAAIERNRAGRALSAARVLLMLLGPDKAIKKLKRAGVLRPSKYAFNALVVDRLLKDWIENASIYRLSASDMRYLRSMEALCALAPSMRTVYLSIMERLRTGRGTIIKTVLAEVSAAFAFPAPVDVGYGDEQHVTAEELAEAFSCLVGMFYEEFGLTPHQFGWIDREAGYSQDPRMLLADALRICRYREAEVLLEGFPFQARRDGDDVRICAVDPSLERSIRLGYVQYQFQEHVHDHHMLCERELGARLSLPAFADMFFEQLGDGACKLQTMPMARYTMKIPIEGPVAQLFRDDGLLVEDVSFCERLAWEDYIEPASVPNLFIAGSVTVLDILKVQRLFRFLHHGLIRALEHHPTVSDRAGLYMASCLPVFTHELMLTAIGLAVGADKATEVLTLLTADLAAPNLDIQYAPIIASNGYYMVSLAIMASSNLSRNVLCRRRQRLVPSTPGYQDPMQKLLAQMLKEAGFLVQEEIDLTVGKDKLEVDVLAYREGHLFIFECKNAYHPCNIYEMRNTYDAMVDAARQLSKRQTWLSDVVNQRLLFENLTWDIPSPGALHTCIALGNRVFNGYTCVGHPVRQVHELLNVLQRGYIELKNGDRVRLWRDEVFSVSDLLVYLAGTTTHADMTDALVPADVVTPIGKTQLIQATYFLDGGCLMDTVLRKYPLIVAVSK
jgi:hypothetical protein